MSFLQTHAVSHVFDCATIKKPPKLTLIVPFALALSLSILLGICFIPLLAHHLKGARRIYTMAQQISIILNSILCGLTRLMFDSTTLMEKYSDRVVYSAALLEYVSGLLRSVLYYNFYFLSLMQSIDIYIMVCWSFHYKKFSSTVAGLRMVALGAGLCLLLCSDELAIVIRIAVTSSTFLENHVVADISSAMNSWQKFDRIAKIFSLVKLCLIKIGFAIAIARIAQLVRKQLISSMAMAANNVDRKKKYTSLVAFVCIPLLMDVIFIIYDATLFLVFFNVYEKEDKCNYGDDGFSIDDIAVRAFVFAVNSFIQSISYLVLFPKFRKCFWCKME